MFQFDIIPTDTIPTVAQESSAIKNISFDQLIDTLISDMVHFAISLTIAILVFYAGKYIIRKLYNFVYGIQKNTSHIEARNREIKADFEKTAVSYQQQMINKIWAQAGMKALAEIADIYPRMTSIHDSSLFDDSFAMDFINYGDKIIYCAMYLYVGYINEATNFAESQGGGDSDTKDWGREKDEDEIEWIRRCLRQATKMMKPMKRKGLCR